MASGMKNNVICSIIHAFSNSAKMLLRWALDPLLALSKAEAEINAFLK